MTAARLIASGLGIGFFPRAPGTAGSLAALLVGVGLLWLGLPALAAAALAAAIVGVWAIGAAAPGADPGWVVIDEVAGQWVAMLALPGLSLAGPMLAFALFRLFDILKPGPIGWVDRRSGPWAVMGDDLLAGALAAAVLAGLRLAWPGLLA